MKASDVTQKGAQNQPATQQRKGTASLESPQGEQISQLEAMANNSPQVTAQRQLADAIQNSPAMTVQRKAINGMFGATTQREEAPAKPNDTGLDVVEGRANQQTEMEEGKDVGRQSLESVTIPGDGIAQGVWIRKRGGASYRWDELVEGAQWYCSVISKKMWYERDGETSPRKTREEWVKLYGSDPLGHLDGSVVYEEELELELEKKEEQPRESVEAGRDPVCVQGKDIIIKGLIMCVAVHLDVKKGGIKIAMIGGHFVTPEMFDKHSGNLKEEGVEFVEKIRKLLGEIDGEEVEATYYVSQAVSGIGQAQEDGIAAAQCLTRTLMDGEIGPCGSTTTLRW